MPKAQVYRGVLAHSLTEKHLEVIEAAIIVSADGTILTVNKAGTSVTDLLEQFGLHDGLDADVFELEPGEFLMPGFVDTHNHAPQWMMRGIGQGLHILDWLEKITFAHEARFADTSYAKEVYADCVAGFLRQGITTASYYGSLHLEATKILADECLRQGQRALVGKCNMTRNAPDFYREPSIDQSMEDTEECVRYVRKLDPSGELLQYVVTPRFAITCEDELLQRLGTLANKENLAIQTHFNEAEQEINFTRSLFPGFKNETDLYNHFGLLNERSILAHCCFMLDEEYDKVAQLKAGVAHCPVSNMTVGGGFMTAPIRRFLDKRIKVGLGTDSGGGFSSSILDAMRQAMIASNHRELISDGADARLSMEELFFLATLGGAQVCGLDKLIGNFEVGKQFDALLISGIEKHGIMTPHHSNDSARDLVEKFVLTGDDRNIRKVFVKGRQVK